MRKVTPNEKEHSLTGIEIAAWWGMGLLFLFGLAALVFGIQII